MKRILFILYCCAITRVEAQVCDLNTKPVAAFNYNAQAQCIRGNQFSLSNVSFVGNGTLTYKWYFGNGDSSAQKNAIITYNNAGNFLVKLIATNSNGCKDSVSKTFTVYPKPLANFSINNTTQCTSGNSFAYSDLCTISSGAVSYLWDLGDGNTDIIASPQHSYATEGSYPVKLIATSNFGCADSLIKTVTVLPKVNLQYLIDNASQCIDQNNFNFNQFSSISAGSFTFAWDFGDGITSAQSNPIHQYSIAGNYDVTLFAFTDKGCKDSLVQQAIVHPRPSVNFDINQAKQCLGSNQFTFANTTAVNEGTATYYWNFGNGSASVATSPSYTYAAPSNYFVTLAATSNYGCKDSITKNITVLTQPATPQIQANGALTICEGDSVQLYTSILVNKQWYADGVTLSGVQSNVLMVHQSGVYTVGANNANGCASKSAEVLVTVNVLPNPIINGPSPNFICENSSTPLTASSNNFYQWFFNDQAITAANAQSYSASQPGSYAVKATNIFNCSKMSAPIAIALNKKPIAAFSLTSSCTNQLISFLNQSQNFGWPTTYQWNFGDGTISTLQQPVHLFTKKGTYRVVLTVFSTNCNLLVDSMVKNITIQDPKPGIQYLPVDAVANVPTPIFARLLTNATYNWAPFTGLSNTAIYNPIVTINADRTYTILITDGAGCVAVDTQLVRIFKAIDIYVPKVFTPNSDGLEDRIFPIPTGVKQLNYFRIYNRWGNMVFEAKTVYPGWDGKFNNQDQPIDTYIWEAEAMDYTGKLIRRKGTITIIR